MTLVVPSVSEEAILNLILNQALTLKLYSNDVTPAEGDTAGSYTEVAGGGYASKPLTFANWDVTVGDPSFGLYNAAQDFSFTGVTDAPGTVYGYFVINASGLLMWAERFDAAVLPFTPIVGSLISVTPRLEAS